MDEFIEYEDPAYMEVDISKPCERPGAFREVIFGTDVSRLKYDMMETLFRVMSADWGKGIAAPYGYPADGCSAEKVREEFGKEALDLLKEAERIGMDIRSEWAWALITAAPEDMRDNVIEAVLRRIPWGHVFIEALLLEGDISRAELERVFDERIGRLTFVELTPLLTAEVTLSSLDDVEWYSLSRS